MGRDEAVGDPRQDSAGTFSPRCEASAGLHVLGEAVRNVSDPLEQEPGDVEPHAPITLRNRLVHGYESIDHQMTPAGMDVLRLFEHLIGREAQPPKRTI